MSRRLLSFTLLVLSLTIACILLASGCESSGGTYVDPLFINQGVYKQAVNNMTAIYVAPTGVNIAVGGMQQFRATAYYKDGTHEEITGKVEWFTENPIVGAFDASGGRFVAQAKGVAVVRCRATEGEITITSHAGFVNSYNPLVDFPPAIPQNPSLTADDEGVWVSWDLDTTDSDIAGYNIYRSKESGSSDGIKVNDIPILYPPFLDKTTVGGWYYYRITAEDLYGFLSAPSEEKSVFITATSHYGEGYDGSVSSSDEANYHGAFTTAY